MKKAIKRVLQKKLIASFIVDGLLKMHNFAYRWAGVFSQYLEKDKLHPKHRLMDYHAWFVNNLKSQWIVLDIGCGNGALTYDLKKGCSKVIGIDFNPDNIARARQIYSGDGIKYIIGDATVYDFKSKVDVIVLSNVLEHIEHRIEFLKKIMYLADVFLIRVPMINRAWITLYKKERGVEYRLDPTHYIEYTFKSIKEELNKAGLNIINYDVLFGEIYLLANVNRST